MQIYSLRPLDRPIDDLVRNKTVLVINLLRHNYLLRLADCQTIILEGWFPQLSRESAEMDGGVGEGFVVNIAGNQYG